MKVLTFIENVRKQNWISLWISVYGDPRHKRWWLRKAALAYERKQDW